MSISAEDGSAPGGKVSKPYRQESKKMGKVQQLLLLTEKGFRRILIKKALFWRMLLVFKAFEKKEAD